MTDGNAAGAHQPPHRPIGTTGPWRPTPPGASGAPGHGAGGNGTHAAATVPAGPPTMPYEPRPAAAPTDAESPWWAAGARSDPWRDPGTTATVRHTAPPAGPPTDPMVVTEPAPRAPQSSPMGLVVTVALITALVAGGLGAAIGILSVRGGTGTTGAPPVDRPVGSVADVVATVMPSVVTILIASADGEGNGSGFVVSEDGYIITNNHVANPAEMSGVDLTVVFSDGSREPAELVGTSVSSDVSVVKVDRTGLSPVTFADSESLAVGDPVLAIGAPLDLQGTVTQGIISALDRPVVTGEDAESSAVTAAIQTDAAINPGNSGGPLFDASGRVIGVNASIATFINQEGKGGNMGIGFAIPINLAKRLGEEIIATGSASRTVLGVSASDTPNPAGVKITDVDPSGPAAAAGIEGGDVITSFNGHRITEAIELVALVRKYAPDAVVEVTLLRGGNEQTVSVRLAADTE